MDQYDLLLLRQFENIREEQARGNRRLFPSIQELANSSGLSVGSVHNRLQDLVRRGLIQGPQVKKQARAYSITRQGTQLLEDERRTSKYQGVPEWPPRSTAR